MATVFTNTLPSGTPITLKVDQLDITKLKSDGAETLSNGKRNVYTYSEGDPEHRTEVTILVTYDAAKGSNQGVAHYSVRLRFWEEVTVGSEEPYYIPQDAVLAWNVPGAGMRNPDGVLLALGTLFGLMFGGVDASSYPTTEVTDALAFGFVETY